MEDFPPAAVAIVRVLNPEPQYLVLERAHHPLDPWSGHLSFPGGKIEEGDKNLFHTCTRETREETGIDLSSENLEHQMSEQLLVTRKNVSIRVHPFLFFLKSRPRIRKQEKEVVNYLWVHENYILKGKNHGKECLIPEIPRQIFPYLKMGEQKLWGFTYKILLKALEHIHGKRLPPF